jgi:hypothetical protein
MLAFNFYREMTHNHRFTSGWLMLSGDDASAMATSVEQISVIGFTPAPPPPL